jgi:hypothetical protein
LIRAVEMYSASSRFVLVNLSCFPDAFPLRPVGGGIITPTDKVVRFFSPTNWPYHNVVIADQSIQNPVYGSTGGVFCCLKGLYFKISIVFRFYQSLIQINCVKDLRVNQVSFFVKILFL